MQETEQKGAPSAEQQEEERRRERRQPGQRARPETEPPEGSPRQREQPASEVPRRQWRGVERGRRRGAQGVSVTQVSSRYSRRRRPAAVSAADRLSYGPTRTR